MVLICIFQIPSKSNPFYCLLAMHVLFYEVPVTVCYFEYILACSNCSFFLKVGRIPVEGTLDLIILAFHLKNVSSAAPEPFLQMKS